MILRSATRLYALLLIVIPVLALSSSAQTQPPTLQSLHFEKVAISPNLLSTSSFRSGVSVGSAGSEGSVKGWGWSARNTNATLALSREGHTAGHAIAVKNGTEFGADIYGMLTRNGFLALKPGTRYVLSAWTKSEDPGIAWIGGGRGWQIRLQLPPTGGAWRRVWLNFVAAEEDQTFELRFCTESPCRGLLLDDIKLEEGTEPTPSVPEQTTDKIITIDPLLQNTEVEGDGPFHSDFILYTSKPVLATFAARLASGAPITAETKLEPGAWRVRVEGSSQAADDAEREVSLSAHPAAQPTISARQMLRIYSAKGGVRRIAALTRELKGLRTQLDSVRATGQDVSYPLVSYTVLENFIRYATEDIKHGEVRRALMQIGDLEPMLRRCRLQLDGSGTRSGRLPSVPRWVGTTRPTVEHGAFLAPVFFGAPGSNVPASKNSAPQSRAVRPVFFTGYGAFGQVRADLEKFPSYGVNIIQIEVGPSAIFPKEGVVDTGPIEEMQSILTRAAKAGVAVNLLISPHYFPEWMLNKYPYLHKKREGFLAYCLHAPESKALLQRFVQTLIPPLKDYPALQSICLSNEPVNVEEPCEFATAEWREYLKKIHGSIAALNSAWSSNYSDFEAIAIPDPFKPDTLSNASIRLDYYAYNRQFFAGWHRMLAEAVHSVAPGLPVHVKAMTWTMVSGAEARYGVDAEQFGSFSDINGNDSSNTYEFGAGEFAQGWQMNALDHDLQRSVREAPVFNSENHIITDRDTRYVPATHIYTALWQAAVHGQSATAIWVWERTFNPNADEAGSIMHRPACAEAVGIVNCDLNRAAIEVTALQRASADVSILVSNTARALDPGRYTDSLFKLYTALTFRGMHCGFITEEALERGATVKSRLLYVPSMAHLSARAGRTLLNAAPTVILVGDSDDELTRDEYNRPILAPKNVEHLNYRYGKSGWRELFERLGPQLSAHGVVAPVRLETLDGKPVTGIEWRTVHTSSGLVVNMVNYLRTTQNVRLAGNPGQATDILKGKPLSATITLKPLEPLLIRISR